MKFLSARNIFLVFILLCALGLAGRFLFSVNKGVESGDITMETNIGNGTVSQEKYKTVAVSNGRVSFKFKVPNTWITETRNMGAHPMTEKEMREFFKTNYDNGQWGDYIDYRPKDIDAMTSQQLERIFEYMKEDNMPGYPNASVSNNGEIWYTDVHGGQIDFFILTAQDAKRYFNFDVLQDIIQSSNTVHTKGDVSTSVVLVDGIPSQMIESNAEGKVSGDLSVYVPIKNGGQKGYSMALIIRGTKTVGESDFQSGFQNLLRTLEFQ